MMEKNYSPAEIVARMLETDYFSQWLGIKLIETGPGHCVLRMEVRKEMLNGFGILHGGVAFSLADSALAFASNSHGKISVALDNSISYPAAAREGDILTARTEELNLTDKTGLYLINITNQHQKKIAVFKGTVYRKEKSLFGHAGKD